MPRVSPKLLDPTFAQTASNCYLARGKLEPTKAPQNTAVSLQSGTKTIYWFNREANSGNGYWFQWSTDVNVVRGPIANDTSLRTYFTGNGVPKYTTSTLGQSGGGPYPGVSRDLGLPAPNAPTATGPSGSPPEGGQKVSTAYVMTYVSDLGEEGPPSPASAIVDRWDGGTVSLTGLSVASGNFVVSQKRIYRAELNGNYQYVGAVSAATTVFSDNIDSDLLGEPVPSTDWDAPNAAMVGLTALPNGILMGWWGNTLAFSEAYQPHAWPIGYRLALDYDIVGAAVSASGVVVVTKGIPYLIAGTSPASMSQNKLDIVQAGVAKRSVVDMGKYVVYASADGLVSVGGTDAQVITEPHITPEQWRTMFKPDSIHAYRWDDRYLAFYNNGTTSGSFSFHPKEGFRLFSDYVDCAFADDRNGDLYVKQGTLLKKWNYGISSTYTWKSKIISVPPSQLFGVCKIDADGYPVTFNYYADGNLVKNVSVTSKQPFRLPTTARYTDAEVQVSGTNAINLIQLATSMSEID